MESNTSDVSLVGDEGQKARKTKQEVFPTPENVFTKLQLLSYFDQHQVTSQVSIQGCLSHALNIPPLKAQAVYFQP
jgi:hypothetical protein